MKKAKGTFSKGSRGRRLCGLEVLEPRQMLSGEGVDETFRLHADLEIRPEPGAESFAAFEAPLATGAAESPLAGHSAGAGEDPTRTEQTTEGVPALDSLPGAAASLYLDFDGHFEPQWGAYHDIVTPAFDLDGDPGNFSDRELTAIRQIWEHVAEDFAPFAINVTTVEPPGFADREALRVVIGGDSSWLGGRYGGAAYLGAFSNPLPNTVYVFPVNLANGDVKFTADAVSHEAGHGFGLRHQSVYDANGTKTAEYHSGTGDGRAPLMGNSYAAPRSVWWQGPSSRSPYAYQDDMDLLAGAANGFGYRSDDHGNTPQASTPLAVSGDRFSAAGLIGTTDDVDVFAFEAGAGQVEFAVEPPANVQNLDATVELLDATGQVLASADPSDRFGASISLPVAAGTYYLRVGSHGEVGDVGTYTIQGTAPPVPVTTATTVSTIPGHLRAAILSSISSEQADRTWQTWQNRAASERAFWFERDRRPLGRWRDDAQVARNHFRENCLRTRLNAILDFWDSREERFGFRSSFRGRPISSALADAALADDAWVERLRFDRVLRSR